MLNSEFVPVGQTLHKLLELKLNSSVVKSWTLAMHRLGHPIIYIDVQVDLI